MNTYIYAGNSALLSEISNTKRDATNIVMHVLLMLLINTNETIRHTWW